MTKIKVAFIGRSNVGKSSLINFLLGRGELAKTSKHPGKTRKHQVIAFDSRIDLVDMPGYGYAKTRGANRALWDDALIKLFFEDDLLREVFVLVDSSISPMKIDTEFLSWLAENHIRHSIIFTKYDKAKPQELAHIMAAWKKNIGDIYSEIPPAQFEISVLKKKGDGVLREYIKRVGVEK